MVMQPIADLTSGFRVVRAARFRQFLYLLPNGFSYPTTITMSFFRAGYGVAYVPIHSPRRASGASHIHPLRDGLRFLLIIIKIGTLSPQKAFPAHQRGLLPDGACLLPVYLCDCRAVYQHERAAVHLGGFHVPDRDCFRADFRIALQEH